MADIVAKGKKTRSATVSEPADKISPELVKLLDEKREAFARAEEELGTVVLPLATDKNLSFAELLTTGGVSYFTNQDDWQQAFQISPEGDTKPKEDAIDQASHPQSKHTTWRSLRGRLTLEDKKTGEDPIEPPTIINHDLDSLPTICRLDHYDMKLYGNMPLSDDCVVIKCRSCGKPVIPSAFIYHTENCTREPKSGITPPRYVEPPPGKLAPSMKKRRTSAVADSGAKGENEEKPSAGAVQGKAIKSSTIPKNMAKVGASAANSTAPSSTTTSPSSSPAKGKGIDDKKGSDGKGSKGDKGKKKVKITNKASARNKGPIDLDRQCGVRVFPSMAMCTRSLTCKSHSMSSKRGVLGRTQPYDELLALYQSKSIGRPKISEKGDNPEGVVTGEVGSSCPAESKLAPGTVEARLAIEDTILDSDEEVDALMEALSSRALYPLATRPVHFYKRQREALRVREMLFEALQHQREAAVLNSAARRSHMNSHKSSFQQPHSSLHSRPIPQTVHSPHTTFQHIQHPMTPQQQHFVSPAQLQISNHVGDSG